MTELILTTKEQLFMLIKTAVREEISNAISLTKTESEEEEFYTREDVMRVMKFSRSTFYRRRKKGIIPKGKRVEKIEYFPKKVIIGIMQSKESDTE